MANFFGKFNSAKQEWATPQSLFDKLNDEFHFTIDLAADETNHKCEKYFSKEDDALRQDWSGYTGWINPPYGSNKSKLQDWIKKAHYEAEENGCTVVMLIPARTNTKWWHRYCMQAAEVRFLCGRPKFGNANHGLPQPLAIIVFQKHSGETKFLSFEI